MKLTIRRILTLIVLLIPILVSNVSATDCNDIVITGNFKRITDNDFHEEITGKTYYHKRSLQNGRLAWTAGTRFLQDRLLFYDGNDVHEITADRYLNYLAFDGSNVLFWDTNEYQLFDGTTKETTRFPDWFEPTDLHGGRVIGLGKVLGAGRPEEVYTWSLGAFTRVTYNVYYDEERKFWVDPIREQAPRIHNRTFAWVAEITETGEYDIFLNNTRVHTAINTALHEPKLAQVGDGCALYFDDPDGQLYLYDGVEHPMGPGSAKMLESYYPWYHSWDFNPHLMDNGQVVWEQDDGTDSEIYLYDGNAIIALTDNNVPDRNPHLDNGYVVWYHQSPDGRGTLLLYNGIDVNGIPNVNEIPKFDEYGYVGSLSISNGQVVWKCQQLPPYGGGTDIVCYDNRLKATFNITENPPGFNVYSPILDNGWVAWCQDTDDNNDCVPDGDWEIFLTKVCPDRDGDGLCDDWETEGIDIGGDGIIDLDLPALGADPNHKDLFVEVDAMAGPNLPPPTQATLDRVRQAFADAPVSNPDENDGITLHAFLDVNDVNIPRVAWPNAFAGFDAVKATRFGTPAQRGHPNWENIKAAKSLVYRYCIFANTHSGTTSSGMGELPGNDFMVTLGGWPGPGGFPACGGTADQQAGTFMHELGHNLDLYHGGDQYDPRGGMDYRFNWKPNYHSIMNYLWQYPRDEINLPPAQQQLEDAWNAYCRSWKLDYSRRAFPDLDEAALSEPNGIGGDAGNVTLAGPHNLPWIDRLVSETGPINWNRDADSNDPNVQRDINWRNAGDPASPRDVLRGYEDWSNLRYQLGGHPNFQDGVHTGPSIHNEMTYEMFLQLSLPGCAPWDIYCDGRVDFKDFAILGSQWLQEPDYPSADIAPDGGDSIVDFRDLDILVQHWLEDTTP